MFFLTAIAALLFLSADVEGQCSIPAPLNNGRNFQLASASMKIVLSSSSGGVIDLGGTNYTFACNGFSSNQYFGILTASIPFLGPQYVGFCMQLRTMTSSTVQAFQWGSNLTTLPGTLGSYYVEFGGLSVSSGHSAICTAGGHRPELEDYWFDTSAGNFVHGTLPTALQCEWTIATINGTAACTTVVLDGKGNTGYLRINGTCPQLAAFYPATTQLFAINDFSIGSNTFAVMRNSTAAVGETTCMSYGISGTTLTATLEKNGCGSTQTSTTISGNNAGLTLTLTQGSCAASIPGTGGGSGASALYPSLLLILAAFVRL